MLDLIIIGAGPAGLAAAIQAARCGLQFKVFERVRPGGQALAANLIEDYPGFPDGISGRALMDRFITQAARLGAVIEKGEVTSIERKGEAGGLPAFAEAAAGRDDWGTRDRGLGYWEIRMAPSNPPITSKNVIVATGLVPKKIDVEGEVYYYPRPNEVPHEGKHVLIIGGGDAAFDEAISFSKKAGHVTIAMRGDVPKARQGLVKRAVEAGVEIKTGVDPTPTLPLLSLPADALMAGGGKGEGSTARQHDIIVMCIGKEPDLSMFSRLSDIELIPGEQPRYPGLFLVGDLVHGEARHVAIAVGDGLAAVAAISGKR